MFTAVGIQAGQAESELMQNVHSPNTGVVYLFPAFSAMQGETKVAKGFSSQCTFHLHVQLADSAQTGSFKGVPNIPQVNTPPMTYQHPDGGHFDHRDHMMMLGC